MTDDHLQITRDGQRQFKRECDGRYAWNKRMAPKGRDKLTRQQIRREQQLEDKAAGRKRRRRSKVDRFVRNAENEPE